MHLRKNKKIVLDPKKGCMTLTGTLLVKNMRNQSLKKSLKLKKHNFKIKQNKAF